LKGLPAGVLEGYLLGFWEDLMVFACVCLGVMLLQAVNDFISRIRKYEEVYEAIQDRNIHYIKLTDM
jgi:hypothetical protein